MYPTLSLGPLAIPTAPLTIIIGLWLLLETSERSARYHQQSRQRIYNLVFTGLIATFLGARLTFVALHWSAFQNNLWGIVWPLTNGYTGWAGLVVGVFAMLLYARRHQLPLWPTLDTLAPGLDGKYQDLTRLLGAVDKDLGLALDSERRLVLQEHRDELAVQRDEISVSMADLERRLAELGSTG